MKTVKILSGAYGFHTGISVKPIYRGEKVQVPDSEAERLLKIGAAEIVSDDATPIVSSPEQAKAAAAGITSPDDNGTRHFELAQLMNMTLANLKKMADDMGVCTSSLKTKADYARAIAGAETEAEIAADGEEPPQLSAEAPVV